MVLGGIRLTLMTTNQIYILSPEAAYAIGLIATDGNLSKDGRHIDLTSKDRQQLTNFLRCFKLKVKITSKSSGYSKKRVPRLQFSNVKLYKFFISIGISPAKTKTLAALKIPDKYYFNFLRGHFDGDGCFYSYWDKRWPNSYMFYLVFNSGSFKHIKWLQNINQRLLGVKGHIYADPNQTTYSLKYAKSESLPLLRKMYHTIGIPCLERKRLKIIKALAILKLTLYK